MKLLIVTQAVDVNHPILGFFHRWIEEFAKHAEHIHVIALQAGEHALPEHVTVHSLGKEHGANLFQKIATFYGLVFGLRREYDAVFVHMNPEYVVLAGWWWRLTGKKVGLWYNHTVGSFWLRIAQPFTNTVFHTSPFAYTARYKNAQRMPAGIDTEVFKPHPEVEKIPKSIYFQGRIAPAKNVHVLLEAFAELYEKGIANRLTLVGPEVSSYTEPLKEAYKNLIAAGTIVFMGPQKNTKTPKLYAAHSVSVNLTAAGNYDKTVLESLACGTPVVVASDAFGDLVPPEHVLPSLSALREVLGRSLLNSSHSVTASDNVTKEHSLARLAKEVAQAL